MLRRFLPAVVPLLLLAACGGNARTDASGTGGAGGEVESSAGAPAAGAPAGGAPGALDSCSSNADCVLVGRGCCNCGDGPLSSFAAINAQSREAFYASECPLGGSCGACASAELPVDASPRYYTATCDSGACKVVDLRTTPITDCVTDADCRGRSGVGCCDDCDSNVEIAINASVEVDLRSLVCDPTTVKCRDCGRSVQTGVGSFPRCREGKCALVGGCNQCF